MVCSFPGTMPNNSPPATITFPTTACRVAGIHAHEHADYRTAACTVSSMTTASKRCLLLYTATPEWSVDPIGLIANRLTCPRSDATVRSHCLTIPSSPADRKVSPSGVTARPRTKPLCPTARHTQLRRDRSHTRISPSQAPLVVRVGNRVFGCQGGLSKGS